MATSDSEEDLPSSLFQEPASYRAPSPEPTQTTYTLLSGSPTLTLNLVGSSPLWGHILWHTSTTLAGWLERNPSLIKDKTILELGAGAGLPSLVSAILGAKSVCVTDYPEADLVQNLAANVKASGSLWAPEIKVVAEGYLWGKEAGPMMAEMLSSIGGGFDVLILSDLLFNHSEHGKLVETVKKFLKQPQSRTDGENYPRAFVFFTPHRPWLYEKDLAFFERAQQEGLVTERIFTEVLSKPMFINDRGDEQMRRTVEGWEMRWP